MTSKSQQATQETISGSWAETLSRRGFLKASALTVGGLAALQASAAIAGDRPLFIIMEQASGMIVCRAAQIRGFRLHAGDKPQWENAINLHLKLLGANNQHVVPGFPHPRSEFYYAGSRWLGSLLKKSQSHAIIL